LTSASLACIVPGRNFPEEPFLLPQVVWLSAAMTTPSLQMMPMISVTDFRFGLGISRSYKILMAGYLEKNGLVNDLIPGLRVPSTGDWRR
jgi:hypothetical protein